MAGDRKHERTLVISWRLLTEAPAIESTNGDVEPIQVAFDDQHDTAVAEARRRVQLTTGLDLEVLADKPMTGHLARFTAIEDPAAEVQRVVEAAWGPHAPPELVSSEVLVQLVSDGEQPADPRSPAAVMGWLRDGYQLRVRRPHLTDGVVADLVADLAMATGGADPTLYYGIRTALGEPPSKPPHARVLVQLSGRRSVSRQGEADQESFRVDPGSVVLVPKDCVIAGLPTDADSLHLAIDLADGLGEVNRSHRAMIPGLSGSDWTTARAVLDADPDAGWPVRLNAPGGVQVVAVDDATVTLAAGRYELQVDKAAVGAMTAIADGAYRSARDLAQLPGVDELDDHEVATLHTTLWQIGLLQPLATFPTRPNERLTQVASGGPVATDLVDRVRALADEDGWRPPTSGEVPFGDHVTVAVQPIDPAEPSSSVSAVRQLVISMNSQFFRSSIVPQWAPEPAFLVRLHAGSEDSAATGEWLASLQSDLLGAGSIRKVTFALSLTAGDGGWIHLPAGSPATASEPGMLSAWASLRPWTFTPVDGGERLLLLGRLHGPAFR